MKRSGGVTASAVIAIIGSALSILLGGLMILGAATLSFAPPPSSIQPSPPVSPVTILLVESIFLIGFGALGIVSSVALLRLRNWARTSFIVFGGLLCLISVFSAIGMVATMFLMPEITNENVPPGFMTGILAVLAVFALLFAGLGIGWVFYLTRASVKAQFLGEGTAEARRGPLSITVVAWLMVAGGLSIPFALLFAYPTIILGFVFRGWAAQLVLALVGIVSLVAGIGILRWRAKAHSLAVAMYAFGLINLISYFVVPGSFDRMRELTHEMMPPSAVGSSSLNDSILWFGMLMGLPGTCLILWLLISRRKDFLDACQPPTSSEPHPDKV